MSGLRIRQFREKNKYSQKDLANILGVSVRTIVRWEQNSSKPCAEELEKVIKLIGVTEEELLNDKEDIDLSSDEPKQDVLGRISDSVDNLVTGQEIINESLTINRDEYSKKQSELINELRQQNKELLEKINNNEKNYAVQEEILRQKKIRNVILIVLSLILIVIIAFIFWITYNFGPNADGIYADQPMVVKTD